MGGITKVFVLGSSVSAGQGSTKPAEWGWVARLATRLRPLNFKVRNGSVRGTVAFWKHAIDAEEFSEFGIVIMSLSLDSEGLVHHSSAELIERITQRYLDGLLAISQALRAKMPPGSRLVLGGPYPNDGHNAAHLQVLHQVEVEMRKWTHVDYVIDFLQPVVHDGQGHWHPGASRDSGHPNDIGHEQMYKCLDIDAIIGPWMVGIPTVPAQEMEYVVASECSGAPLRYRYVGSRDRLMAEAATGFFAPGGNTLTWISYNGDADDEETWNPRNTWEHNTLERGKILRWDGSLGGSLENDASGVVTAVLWGSRRWQLFDPLGVHRGNSFQYRFAGERSGDMVDAAVGWVEWLDGGLLWRSFNGDPEDPSTWTPQDTQAGLWIAGPRLMCKDGEVAAALDLDESLVATVVRWGVHPWVLTSDGDPEQLAVPVSPGGNNPP